VYANVVGPTTIYQVPTAGIPWYCEGCHIRDGVWWRVEGASLSAESRGDTMIIAISGDLDIVTSPELDECLTRAESDHSTIILDFGEVSFLDTSALAVIVGHWKRAEAKGGTLALANARYRYTKTLWITGLADKLTLYETVDAGLAALARPAGSADG
jgi:anti-sigma B factor antagonist